MSCSGNCSSCGSDCQKQPLRHPNITGAILGQFMMEMAHRSKQNAAGEITEDVMDEMDRKILTVLIDHFSGGPVGVKTLAVACSEEIRTIEDIYEPYLIQCGFLNRTPRGRVATPKAYRHLNRLYGGSSQGSLL